MRASDDSTVHAARVAPARAARRRAVRFQAIVDAQSVPVLVFRDERLVHANPAAEQLRERMRLKYRSELTVLLRDHLQNLDRSGTAGTVSLLTGQRGEPFYLHVMPLDAAGTEVAVSVRELGISMDAFRTRYRLSRREAEVVELVLLGYRNRDIAAALGPPRPPSRSTWRISSTRSASTRARN